MKNKSIHISIVIIGYNTRASLKSVLESINNLFIENHIIEVIYIDDGSTDDSLEMFNDYKLQFHKKEFKFNKNRGRSNARSKGVELASGEWILFLNSNIVVKSNIILKYAESIQNNTAYVFSGCVDYTSRDLVFEKYLNHSKRGMKQYKNGALINYQNLLFSNCIIHKSIFDKITFNLDFKYYGGEELEFAYKLHKENPKMIRATSDAVGVRINHPDYKEHLYKLIEFGETNFNNLDKKLKKDIVRCNLLLIENIMFRCFFNALYRVCRQCYGVQFIGHQIIRLGMLSAILKGYYKTR